MNAAALSRFNARVQGAAESLFPATIQLVESPRFLAAATSGIRIENQLASDGGGLVDIDTISFRVRKELLPDPPTPGARILWIECERFLRISRVGDAGAADPAWLLTCEALT